MFLLNEKHLSSRRHAMYDAARARWWSYEELAETVQGLANRLAIGFKALVFLWSRNTVETVLAYLACVEAGHAVALIDPKTPEAAWMELLDRYKPELIVGAEHELPCTPLQTAEAGLPDGMVRRCRIYEAGVIHPAHALLLSTSGTTGSPKFVRLSRRNVEANAQSICGALEITESERAITNLPIHYSYGLSILNSHLWAGAEVVVTGDSIIQPSFWELFRQQACTSLAGVPYTYQMLRRVGFEKMELPSLRAMTQAGGKLAEDMVCLFHKITQEKGGRFFVMYGQTEATARISCLPPHFLPEKARSVGVAIPEGELFVHADGTLTRRPGLSGEVVYRGPNVMLGYATCREDLQSGDEMGGELETGDIGCFDEDGLLYILGRSKRIGKVFGLRVNLDEVESMLKIHGPSAVVGGDDKILVYCEYGDAPTFDNLAKELASRFKINYRTFEFRRVEELPLKSNGKIDYKQLEVTL